MPQSRDEMLRVNRDAWDRISAREHGRTALPLGKGSTSPVGRALAFHR